MEGSGRDRIGMEGKMERMEGKMEGKGLFGPFPGPSEWPRIAGPKTDPLSRDRPLGPLGALLEPVVEDFSRLPPPPSTARARLDSGKRRR